MTLTVHGPGQADLPAGDCERCGKPVAEGEGCIVPATERRYCGIICATEDNP